MLTSVIQKGYRDFIGKVAMARGKTADQVDEIAQGRVWSGTQARERGLVDKLGGLHDSIKAAAAMANLGSDYRSRYVENEISAWERFALSLSNSGAMVRFGHWSGLLSLQSRLLGDSEVQRTLRMLSDLGGNRFGVVAHCSCSLN
jgi:protease IV